MATQFTSKALEANLAETRYRDIYIPEEYQNFISLSEGYYGIKKRATDCITEFHHPLSNRKFVIEELREILITDFWFYAKAEMPENALRVPVDMMDLLLGEDNSCELRLLIARTLLELITLILQNASHQISLAARALEVLQTRFDQNKDCFIRGTLHFKRHLDNAQTHKELRETAFALLRQIKAQTYHYWQRTTQIESWIKEQGTRLNSKDKKFLTEALGAVYFKGLLDNLESFENWDDLLESPDYEVVSKHFIETGASLDTFLKQFQFQFYLLHLPGLDSKQERMIWNLDKMIRHAIDELKQDEVIPFIDLIFSLAEELRETHLAAVLDFQLTLGLKVIDIDESEHKEMINHFEKKLIAFGFASPGMVFVDEDWQLSVNENHIKNIRIWLQLIEYSQSLMEKLLSALIVNLRLGGIFISDTDLFQREITKILNSNIAPYYKKVKQLTRIFPVYFSEIGAEGEIRKVTTTMDEICGRQDKLIHFLRKQVHTESNNTLIALTRRVFRFWHDGDLQKLRDALPDNVYQYIDTENEYFVTVHQLVNKMASLNHSDADGLLSCSLEKFEDLLEQAIVAAEADSELVKRDSERLHDIRVLYDHLREKYSFETVNIIALLRRYPFIPDEEIDQLQLAMNQQDYGHSLKLIYAFMERLKAIIFNPKESESWENIYHKRHIAIGIPSMYGVYRENKFEALGLTFRLEKVATRLMEKVVSNLNLDYISARTLEEINSILEDFKAGLELDGITNQSFNSNLQMLRYSLTSRSFSFDQYINIFQFLAEDVKRIIIKYFLKSYEYPLKIVIPQIFDPLAEQTDREMQQLISMKSEAFHRDVIAEAFLVQPLDNFISRILQSLRSMSDRLDGSLISDIMSYNSELVISPFTERNPKTDNQVFLGSKAYHLKNLYLAGIPVPPGFVITTEVFRRHQTILSLKALKTELHDMIRKYLKQLEELRGKRFGDAQNPLLLSVRSGTAISMPGAMDTFLNVGLNDELVEAISKRPEMSWSIWDSYRRLIQSWGMAHGIERDVFDSVMLGYKQKLQVKQKQEFEPADMRLIALAYKEVLEAHHIRFVEDLFEQLIQTIDMVFASWSSERAFVYRRHLQFSDNWGTAVIVQEMVYGNLNDQSGTGVVFTQNPHRERPGVHLYGDFNMRSQGEDIVAGLVKPAPVSETQRRQADISRLSLQISYPEIYKRIHSIATELTENLGYSPQEIEFTFESEKAEDLYILQVRDQDLRFELETNAFVSTPETMELAGRGIGIGGGALNGLAAFDEEDLEQLRLTHPESPLILIRPDTVPDDIGMIFNCDGLITARGGATSHAAVTAVRLGKTCVVNCNSLLVDENNKQCELDGKLVKSGDQISIDGSLGNIYMGHYPIEKSNLTTGYNY
jgi:pyruvate,orthophosphate dikinase